MTDVTHQGLDAVTTNADLPVVSLRRSFSWVLSGNVVYALCQWSMISVLAKLGTTAVVGQYALALAITAPVFMFCNLFLRGIQATDARSEFEFAHYFTVRATTTTAGLLAVAIIAFAIHHDRTTAAVVMIVGCAKAIESFSDVIAGLLQKHERLDQVSVSMVLKGVLSSAGFVTAFAYTHNLIIAAVALCGAWLSILLAYDVTMARRLLQPTCEFLSIDIPLHVRLIKLATPVGLVVAFGSLGTNIPRYVLERYRGSGELGIFAALSYLVVAIGLIVNALGQSAIVRLSRNFADGDTRQYSKLLRQMSLSGIGLSLAGILLASLCGRPILKLIYGPAYSAHLGLLMLLIGASGITAVGAFLGCGMTSARQFRAQVPVTMSALLTGTAVAFVAVPRWGATGAALALMATAVVQACGGLIVVLHAIRQRNQTTDLTGMLSPRYPDTRIALLEGAEHG